MMESVLTTDNIMATVNQKSVREEAERIKAEFDLLSLDKKYDAQTKMLFKSMLMLINLLVSIFPEKTTKKNNQNSSLPSSKNDKDDSSLTKEGSKGKGKQETHTTAYNSRTIETVELIKVNQCDICGNDLSQAHCEHVERRTKIDIIFEKTVEHIDVEVKYCQDCDATVKGKFPADMPGPLQYGNGLKAYIINLLIAQMISLNRVQKLVKSIVGECIAESTLLKFVLRLYVVLESWETAAIEAIVMAHAMNVDETSLRVDKKNQWIHVYSAGDITLKFLHSKRGTEAIEDINIIPRYSGTIIHDFWSSYLTYTHCDHGMCGGHLVRELQYLIDSNEYHWASNMKKLLVAACKKVSKRKRKKLSTKEYAHLQKNYRNIITRAEKELPPIPEKPNGKSGKIAKSDAHNLLERFKEHETAVLRFAIDPHVPFTNNRAERDLRMAKVKQKVSGCFRKELYAKAYCRISSYLQTMANNGYNPLVAIQMAFAGKFK